MRKVLCCLVFIANAISLFSQNFTRDLKLIEPRMNGNDVVEIQTKLLALGFYQIGTADGWFGPKTQNTVIRYQDFLGFSKNGIIDRALWKALFSSDKTQQQINEALVLINAMQVDIKNEYKKSPKVYHYIFGKNYSESEYSIIENKSDSVFLFELIVAVKRGDGYLIYVEMNTPSGDWFIVQENYYTKDGRLAYVHWDMNTFQASIGLELQAATINKRIFYDKSGKKILERVKAYKMNSDAEIVSDKFSFADREVRIQSRIEELEYYKLLKW